MGKYKKPTFGAAHKLNFGSVVLHLPTLSPTSPCFYAPRIKKLKNQKFMLFTWKEPLNIVVFNGINSSNMGFIKKLIAHSAKIIAPIGVFLRGKEKNSMGVKLEENYQIKKHLNCPHQNQ